MHAMPPEPRLIAVASGKGGVGKTWFAITLAHAMARLGCRVLLFDGDLGLANVDVQLGIAPARDLGAVLSGRATLAQAVIQHSGGFDVLAGSSGTGTLSALDPLHLERMLLALRRETGRYHAVVLDLGAGLERAVRRMAAASDTLLVLATEEPTSLTDAYAVLKLYFADCPEGDARIVVNQATGAAGGERTYAALRRAAARFLGRNVPLAGVVRRDERVREAIRRQMLLLERHPASLAGAEVAAIADGFCRRAEAA
jgi:flagellar biosynthesis protein FlhG